MSTFDILVLKITQLDLYNPNYGETKSSKTIKYLLPVKVLHSFSASTSLSKSDAPKQDLSSK